MSALRHSGDARGLLSFMLPDIAVCCPRCDGMALVWPEQDERDRFTGRAKLACAHCGLSRANHEHRWLGPVWPQNYTTRWRCGACGGYHISFPRRQYASIAKVPRVFGARCSGCGSETGLPLGASPVSFARGALDPFFGLKLFLVANVRGNDLWAFNKAHLDILRSYVSAGLREKRTEGSRPLDQRLPGWMIGSGSRGAAVKALDDLERRLARSSRNEVRQSHTRAFGAQKP